MPARAQQPERGYNWEGKRRPAASVQDWSSLRTREWRPTGGSTATSGGDSGGGGGAAASTGREEGSGGAAAGASGGTGSQGLARSSAASPASPGAAGSVAEPAASSGSTGGKESQGATQAGGSRSTGFRTDTEISADYRAREGRELRRFDAFEPADGLEGSLEELTTTSNGRRDVRHWDQFKVNEEKFGIVSTFKADLSQYTTVLDKKSISKEMRQRAERIAQELERPGASSCGAADGEGDDGDVDEEDLFSAVPRGQRGYPGGGYGDGYGGGVGGGCGGGLLGASGSDAGQSLLASLKAAPAAKTAADGDHRELIRPKVQDWWRARRSAGASVPAGAEEALVCPFSERVFGDISQLVTHWAGALPRAIDSSAETPSAVASEQFGRLGRALRWSEMSAATSLEAALPMSSPRPGSVWEQIINRVARDGGAGGGSGGVASGGAAAEGSTGGEGSGSAQAVAERPVIDFVVEAVRLRCWRRDQKIEHREVMEFIAAGLALYAIADPASGSSPPWGSAGEDGGSLPAASATEGRPAA